MNLPERDTVFIKHILESIELIEEYVKDVGKEEFYDNQQLQDSVVRRFEIIGEASKLVSEDFKKQFPDVLWREATDMRNVLIHAYFGIDYEILWNTIKIELPVLKKQISMIINTD
jgi:uncharacterized protein with HEPN domain